MPPRVPHVEVDAHVHWDLLKAVTGIDVGWESPEELKAKAWNTFIRAWNYDFFGGTLINAQEFGAIRTNMGHSVYAVGGVDYDNDIHCPFNDVEDVLNFDPWEAYDEKNKTELKRRFEEHLPTQYSFSETLCRMKR